MDAELGSLLELLELKDETRTGWDLRGVESPESVAAHTWGTAMLCLLYADRAGEAVDRERAVAMAVVHDAAEARTGDVATRATADDQRITAETKETMERDAIADLLNPFQDDEPRHLWKEYEERETPVSRFVKDMDLVDNCLQALKYERANRYDESDPTDEFNEFDDLDEFFATAAPRLRTPIGESLFEAIKERYEREIGRECQL
ncbi:HD family hydrolase [Natrialba sp. PRR66]|uniref:HD domain-containing protein n=1 Tax=Natrialba sp. PRR66 TaxID=3098146 RepID=UPI002B1DBF54|nr:HD family hydrolase [Natrialba sp. PRR66]